MIKCLINKDKKITTVIYNNPFRLECSKAIVKCSEDDEYNEYIGFALAFCECVFGSKNKFHEFVKDNSRIIDSSKK